MVPVASASRISTLAPLIRALDSRTLKVSSPSRSPSPRTTTSMAFEVSLALKSSVSVPVLASKSVPWRAVPPRVA